MAKGILARKIGMSQLYDDSGKVVPVTVLEAGPCVVTQVKTQEMDKYSAIQLGFEVKPAHRLSKAMIGHFKKQGVENFKTLQEFRDVGFEATVGHVVTADLFSAGDNVKITGISKGKGFAGSIKKHGFSSGRASHGSKFHRAPGSMNSSAYPSRVFKGKKLPGRAGGVTVTVKNVKVVQVDGDHNLLLVKGAVPGARTTLVRIEALS